MNTIEGIVPIIKRIIAPETLVWRKEVRRAPPQMSAYGVSRFRFGLLQIFAGCDS